MITVATVEVGVVRGPTERWMLMAKDWPSIFTFSVTIHRVVVNCDPQLQRQQGSRKSRELVQHSRQRYPTCCHIIAMIRRCAAGKAACLPFKWKSTLPSCTSYYQARCRFLKSGHFSFCSSVSGMYPQHRNCWRSVTKCLLRLQWRMAARTTALSVGMAERLWYAKSSIATKCITCRVCNCPSCHLVRGCVQGIHAQNVVAWCATCAALVQSPTVLVMYLGNYRSRSSSSKPISSVLAARLRRARTRNGKDLFGALWQSSVAMRQRAVLSKLSTRKCSLKVESRRWFPNANGNSFARGSLALC